MSELEQRNGNREAVCAEVMRVFDSCSSQDCLEDLLVTYTCTADQELINTATSVKCNCVEVVNTAFAIAAVPFNKGFFSVDLTYTFKLDLEVTVVNNTNPMLVIGYTTFTKKVILFGGCGASKTFSSDDVVVPTPVGCCSTYMPKASVSVVEPMILDIKLVTCPCPCPPKYTEEGQTPLKDKQLLVTIGMFAIVQLKRAVPMLIRAIDYCIPKKECSTSSDSPCELFDKIAFPTNEFFPRSIEEFDCDCKEECSE